MQRAIHYLWVETAVAALVAVGNKACLAYLVSICLKISLRFCHSAECVICCSCTSSLLYHSRYVAEDLMKGFSSLRSSLNLQVGHSKALRWCSKWSDTASGPGKVWPPYLAFWGSNSISTTSPVKGELFNWADLSKSNIYDRCPHSSLFTFRPPSPPIPFCKWSHLFISAVWKGWTLLESQIWIVH